MRVMVLGAIRKAWWLLVGALLTIGAERPTLAQTPAPELEFLSKADATRIFRLTRQQCLKEIRAAVAAGQAAETRGDARIPGMSTTTPEGDLLTVRVDYSQGDRKPVFIQVVVGYRPPRAALLFPQGDLKQLLDAAKRQMAPEFEVTANAERIEGGLGLFFMILEAKR